MDQHTDSTLLQYFQVGEQRPITAAGPEFRLPDSYYDYAKQHPNATMHLIEERLKLDNGAVRVNAYDFVLVLAEVPATREHSLAILRKAMETEGFVVQKFIKPGYDRIVSQSPATQPK